MPGAPTITVAVITRDRADLLARTLPTVLEQDLPADEFEVIVVDDGSSDRTARLLEEHASGRALRVLRQGPRGVGAARNTALNAARGLTVLFLDDDLLCDPGLARAHATAHAHGQGHGPLIVVGRLGVAAESESRPVSAWLARGADAAHARRSHAVTLRDAFVAANCSAPRALLHACGGFDESFDSREEHELGLRLYRAGARPFYEPRAIARELVDKPVRKLLRDAHAVGRNEVRLCRAYPEYRHSSPLARLAEAPRWKGAARRLTTRSRLAETTLLTAPAWVASRLGPGGRRTAAALVGARYGVALRRGAVAAAGSWRALTEEFGRRLPVLAYHRVGPRVDGANPELTVTPARFRRHIRLLRRLGYTPIVPRAWIAWCRSAQLLPRRPVILTFDDAYADLGVHALEPLLESGFGATLFAPSACLGGENSWDETLRSGLHPVTHRLLGPTELRRWSERGIEIGAHGRTHARLPELAPDELDSELNGGKDDLERLLGTSVAALAYPFGAVDERVRDAAADAFDAGFTIDEGVNTLATEPLLLRRSTVRPTDTDLDVLFRLWLGWSPLHRLRRRVALLWDRIR